MKTNHNTRLLHQPATFLGHPRPLRSLFFSEMWERFSYYGIRPLLVLFMTATVFHGGLGLDTETASAIVGIYTGSVYLAALPGGWLADNWLGQQKAVWYGSIIIALGHLCIALSYLWGNKMFFLGLCFIVIGSGLFKTCVCVMVGELYGKNDERRDSGFSIFYMGINIGGLIAPFITGWFANSEKWHIAFGIGGLGMLVALIIFRYFAFPALEQYNAELNKRSTPENEKAKHPYIGNFVLAFSVLFAFYVFLVYTGHITFNPVVVAHWLAIGTGVCVLVYFCGLFMFSKLSSTEKTRLVLCFVSLSAAACFWAAFEQQPTSFNLFTEYYVDRTFGGFTIPTTWVQPINPLLVIIFAPIFGWCWIFLDQRGYQLRSTTKFIAGILLAAIGFLVMVFATKSAIASGGGKVSILWVVTSLTFLTFGELSLSPVGLSAMSYLAPTKIKSQVMGLWCGATALGNIIAGIIGGQVNANSLTKLPELFGNVFISLCLSALVLFILSVPINRLLKGSGFFDD